MKKTLVKAAVVLSVLTGVTPFLACSQFQAIDPHAETNSSSNLLNALANKSLTVDEWMTLSAADRYAIRATMSTAERYAIWDQLTLEQKYALTEINSAYDALLAGDLGIKPANSPFSVNQWITKSPAERATLRPSLNGSGVDIWNALTLEQKNAMTETNKAYDQILNATDLCAASGYPDIVHIDIPVSYSRTVYGFFFGNETMVVNRFTVPADYVAGPNSFLDATIAEYDGPPTLREATLSTRPCDFRPVDKTGKNGPLSISGGMLPQNFADVGPGKPDPQVLPGQTYYLNVRNYSSAINEGAGGPTCQENTNCRASVTIMIRP